MRFSIRDFGISLQPGIPFKRLSVLGLLVVAACQDATGLDFDPADLGVVRTSGEAQQGLLGEMLPDSVIIWVEDASGVPVVGFPIEWHALTPGSTVGLARSVTDAMGRAATTWTLAPVSGRQELAVHAVLRKETILLKELHAESFPAPSQIRINPSHYGFEVGETVRFSATVLDGAGEEIPGYPITWHVQPAQAGIVHEPPVATIDESGNVTALRPVDAIVIAADALGTRRGSIVPIYQFTLRFVHAGGSFETLTELELSGSGEVIVQAAVAEDLGRPGPWPIEIIALDPAILDVIPCDQRCGGGTLHSLRRIIRPLQSGETFLVARTKMAADTIPVRVNMP